MIRPIVRRSTFDQLQRQGTRVRRGSFGLTYAPVDGDHVQVAFSVPRRVGNAVQRNRGRRRVRAILAARAASGALPAGAYLVQVRAPVHQQPFGELQADLSAALAALAERLAA